MRYIEGFRNPDAAAPLVRDIGQAGAALAARGRTVAIMEVCGSHTMAIARYGIRSVLPAGINLVSGPGCPVCVTPSGYIDAAIELAQDGKTLVTFGDMLNVPGSQRTLADCRAAGADIVVAYTPDTARTLALEHPGREIVFLAIGFETTIVPVIRLVDRAAADGVCNVSLLTAFKLVPPALDALLADPEVRIDGFICPAHVSVIIGADAYLPYANDHGVPCVIAGFEPLDILYGIRGLLNQVLAGEARVDNDYARAVRPGGNPRALALMETYLEPIDADWRGLGRLPRSGLGLRDAYAAFDAARRFGIEVKQGGDRPGCRCGDVVKGKLAPPGCPLFGAACRPDQPVGPCMVSSEGTCAAWFKYTRLAPRAEAMS